MALQTVQLAYLLQIIFNMSDITDQIQDIAESVSDHEDRLGQTESIGDDHENRLGSVENVVGDGTTIGQLDFPLSQDSIDRIKEVYPTNTVSLSGGSVTVSDPRIGVNTFVLYCIKTTSGITTTPPYYSYSIAFGSITFNSSVGTDNSTLVYLIL